MKKILIIFSAIILCLFPCINNNVVDAKTIKTSLPESFYEEKLSIPLTPSKLINNTSNQEINLDSVKEFDFLLSDREIDFYFQAPKGFANITPGSLVFSFDNLSSDPNVATVIPNIEAMSTTYTNNAYASVQLNSVGSCYLNYYGSFSINYGDIITNYDLSGYILINVVDYYANTLSVVKSEETLIKEGSESKLKATFTAIINGNEKLTSYDRCNVIWSNKKDVINKGSSHTVEYKTTYKEDLICTYANLKTFESPDFNRELNLTVNKAPEKTFGDYMSQLWWLHGILLIGLIVLVVYINHKIENLPSIKLSLKYLNSLDNEVLNLEKLVKQEEYKLKRKRVLKSFEKCKNFLQLGKNFCDSAVKEDYYELSDSAKKLIQLSEKMSILDKDKKNISNEKMLRACKRIVNQATVCKESIQETINNVEKANQNALKARENNSQDNKIKIKKFWKKKTKVSAKDILNELAPDEQNPQEQSNKTSSDETDMVGAHLINEKVKNALEQKANNDKTKTNSKDKIEGNDNN